MKAAIYLHIPFCLQRCAYCDFITYVGKNHLHAAYVQALLREMACEAERHPDLEATTLYFGGGTPSLLEAKSIAVLIEEVRARFRLPQGAEITLEANPITLTARRAKALRQAGINRLSLGVQSFDDGILRLLGRLHDATGAVRAVEAARAGGFDNLNLDLIFGIPGQSLDLWTATLTQAIALRPQHLSLYALSVEAGTPLAARIARGELPAPDPDLAATMYELASAQLLAAGYWQYEISNWALGKDRPQQLWQLPPTGRTEAVITYASRHNLTYWRNAPWLGLGVAAHSWLGGGEIHQGEPDAKQRWSRVTSVERYLEITAGGRCAIAESETIPSALEQGETVMMGLRLAEGLSATAFRQRFGISLHEAFPQPIAHFTTLGLLEWFDGRLRLTTRGRLLGNQVFAAFLPE